MIFKAYPENLGQFGAGDQLFQLTLLLEMKNMFFFEIERFIFKLVCYCYY